MDLRERSADSGQRHPWEVARLRAIQSLIGSLARGRCSLRVLDVGCGDGFVGRELSRRADVRHVDGIDVHLTDREVDMLRKEGGKAIFYNDYRDLPGEPYDLVLLLDVLEHVREDGRFLSDIAGRHLSRDGYLILTVPAIPFLYSGHDEYLSHFRRYERKALVRLVHSANLSCIRSGSLFLSLLPIRLLEVLCRRITGGKNREAQGVGGWTAGKVLTRTVTTILQSDNRIALFLNSFGVRIPGLTAWAICRKRA